MIKAMHRREQHSGKVPSSESMTVKMTAEVAILQQQLEQAVAAEDYEKAARLRDAIAEWRAKAAADSEAEQK